MKRFAIFTIIAAAALAWSREPETTVPQTARQALIEMLFSKNPGTFAKHLPDATLAAIAKSGSMGTLQGYSLLATQFQKSQSQEKPFQTFETGPILMTGVNQQSGEKYDVTVENDSLQGDTDNITISFHTYKAGQLQRTPYMPTLNVAMKQESGVWKLNVVSVTIRIPLADPDFLESVTEGIAKAQAKAATALPSEPPHVSTTSFGSDSQVISAMRTILAAESTYSNTYRSVGYTCTLSDLDGFGAADRNEHQAMLIPSDLAGEGDMDIASRFRDAPAIPQADLNSPQRQLETPSDDAPTAPMGRGRSDPRTTGVPRRVWRTVFRCNENCLLKN